MSKTSLVGKNGRQTKSSRYFRDSGNNVNKLRDSGIDEKLVRDSGSRPPLPDPELSLKSHISFYDSNAILILNVKYKKCQEGLLNRLHLNGYNH